MGLFHVAYNGYVGKTPLPQRHPERSRGIFLAGGDNVVCVIAENENASAKEARKSRVQGRFLAALEMTVWGDGYPLYRIKCVLGKCSSCTIISRCARNDGLRE